MFHKTLVVGPFQCNCRVIACPRTGEALVVDPGDEPQKILSELAKSRTPSGIPLRVKYLFHTHGHLDHIGGAKAVAESLTAEGSKPLLTLHRGDEPLYLNLRTQGQLFGIHYEDPIPVDHFVEDEEMLRVGDLKFSVIHTPGHSPGSVCLRMHNDLDLGAQETVLSGDTLFQGSVGRTDLWGGDQDLMFKSIRNRLLSLDDDIAVWPGHGPDTLIGVEKRNNPFLKK